MSNFNRSLAGRKQVLTSRASIFQAVRQYFITEGYLEVDTPFRIPAPAPEVHIDAILSENWYLHTSPELCMKRLLAAGFSKIFQICHCWRSNERGAKHLPEFSMLEWYLTNANYLNLMNECEELVRYVVSRLNNTNSIIYSGSIIDLTVPWERISVREAFLRYTDTSMEEAIAKNIFDELMVERIEPKLGLTTPLFLYDYPAEFCSLAAIKESDPTVAERFELYICGLELANAFTELTDPEEQRARFCSEAAQRKAMNKAPYPSPDSFLNELINMPPSAGIAFGMDRLVMVLLDKTSIDEVIAFSPEEL